MRKFALFLMTVCTFTLFNTCADDIEFNNPSVQGNKDGVYWKAQYEAVDIDFGGWLIEGGRFGEIIQLVTYSDIRGTFELGIEDSVNEAIFVDSEGVVYSTRFEPDPSLSVYPAEGQIIIQDISRNTPKRVYGTFWFTAYSEDGMKSVTFNQGVIYGAPITDGLRQITDR